jgi:hypothetical protein
MTIEVRFCVGLYKQACIIWVSCSLYGLGFVYCKITTFNGKVHPFCDSVIYIYLKTARHEVHAINLMVYVHVKRPKQDKCTSVRLRYTKVRNAVYALVLV